MTEGWGFVWPDLLTSGEDEGLQAGFRRQAGDQPVVLCAQTLQKLWTRVSLLVGAGRGCPPGGGRIRGRVGGPL